MKHFSCLFLTAFLFIGTSCSDNEPQGKLKSVNVQLGSQTLELELAVTEKEHAKGLMFRRTMGEKQGMLFVYDATVYPHPLGVGGFWMKNTYLPLSIGFFSPGGTLQEIFDMKPLDETPVIPRSPYLYALELNQGAYRNLGIKVGDQLDLQAIKKSLP